MGKKEGHFKVALEVIELEQVKSFKYLGAIVNSEGSTKNEIRKRKGMAKQAYTKMQGL